MNAKVAIAALAASMSCGQVLAATSVHGQLPGGEWTSAGSPYVIDGDVSVPLGSTLTINKGVSIQILNWDSLAGGSDTGRVEINVLGNLHTNGAASSPITIAPVAGAAPSTWSGMTITGGGSWQTRPGIKIVGNVSLLTGSAFSGYGVSLDGDLRLGGAFLGGVPDSLVPTGSTYTLFDLAAGRTVNGVFAGLPEGASLSLGGHDFTISYQGGTGNDVVLTSVPEPATASLMGVGLCCLIGLARFKLQT